MEFRRCSSDLRENVLRLDLQLARDEVEQGRRHVAAERQPDHRATAAPLQRALELAHEILGLFLHLDVAVAQHPEGAARFHLEAGEQLIEVEPQQFFPADEALGLARKAGEATDQSGRASWRESECRYV